MKELKIKDLTWISITRPTSEDIMALKERFPQIHPLILEELETPTIRQRVENYDDYLYMVFHFPNFIEEYNKTVSHEVDCILMQDTLITVQYEEIATMTTLIEEFTDDPDIQNQYGKNQVLLLYYVFQQFFSLSLKELDQFQGKIDQIEEEVFSGREKEILEDISLLKRNLLDFRRSIKPQQLTLESLIVRGTELFGNKAKPYLIDLLGEYLKVWSLLENHKETLDALFETNNALLTSKINEIMRAFTVLAFISFIPTAIANIYGMNIVHMPFMEDPNAFWIIMGFMAGITGLVYILLKLRKLV